MATAPILIATTIASAAAGVYSIKAAEGAAEAQAKTQQNYLKRRESDQRNAMVENTKRGQQNKERYLAKLRLSQAAGGFDTRSGTPLAVFGEIENRIDDEIDQTTNRALDALAHNRQQQKNVEFNLGLQKKAFKTDMISLGVNTAASFAGGYAENYDRTKQDPFNIFK